MALHHSGVPETDEHGNVRTKTGQVWREGLDNPALIAWLANEGARVSAIVACLQKASLRAEWRALRSRMLDQAPPNPIELARATEDRPRGLRTTRAPAAGATSETATLTLNVPLTLTVAFGHPGEAAAVARAVVAADEAPEDAGLVEKVEIDPDWSRRSGYDPRFLGVDVPLPGLSAGMKKDTAKVDEEYRKDGDEFELAYHHYSLKMNKRRRIAWFSAANVDGDRRYNLGKRQGDRWFKDPRIGEDAQLGQEAFESGIDRGHLTRREDVAWGGTMGEARTATNDTFFFTNCSLQAAPFNRGKDRWQGLEQFLLEKHAKPGKRRMAVMTGPVLRPRDPRYQNDEMDYAVRCPLEFWKVCVLVREDGSVAATAFVMGQEGDRGTPRIRGGVRRAGDAGHHRGSRGEDRPRLLAGSRPTTTSRAGAIREHWKSTPPAGASGA